MGNKYIKRCSILLVNKEMYIKITKDTTVLFIEWLKLKRLTIPRVDKDVEQLVLSYLVAGNAKLYSSIRKEFRRFIKI